MNGSRLELASDRRRSLLTRALTFGLDTEARLLVECGELGEAISRFVIGRDESESHA